MTDEQINTMVYHKNMNTTYGWDIDLDCAQNYANVCNELVKDDEIFKNFKSSAYYNAILEHVNYELGGEYYNQIQKLGKDTYEKYLNKFLDNDLIGNPIKYNYAGVEISPTTLRYIKNTVDLISIYKDQKISKVVEVGCGYGGLCKTLSVVSNFNEYVNIDLPEALNVQKKYLSNFPEINSRIKFIPCNQLQDIYDIDIFISNYALSELDIASQLDYYDKLIKNSKIVYIIYNFIIDNAQNNYNTIVSKLIKDGFELNTDYYDGIPTSDNKVIVGVKNSTKNELERIAQKLGGKLSHYICDDTHNQHKKYVITYT